MALYSSKSQRTSKCGKNIGDTLSCALCATFFVPTTFWRHLWSITEQTHGNMESIFLNPLHPSINVYITHTDFFTFSQGAKKENLFINQENI